uniref:VWFA domain-containing protein n=1 Tax=Globodera rostochiensis TaxID=31243 RepID=A0A914HYE5_GLORO
MELLLSEDLWTNKTKVRPTARMKKYNHHTFVLSFILLAYFHKIGVETTAAPKVSISSAENECPSKNRSSVLQTVVLFDVSPENQVDFQQQKDRLIKTLRNIDRFSFGRQRFYELIIFHRTPIDKLQSTNIEEITGQIEGLSMTTIHETSPAKALNEGRSVVEKMPQAQSVILLVHDGHNTDMASETLSASARLSKLKVSIFAIAGGKTPPALAKLSDYTGERRRVFAFEQDSQQFLDALDEEIDSCPFPSPPTVTNFAKEKSDDVAPVEQPPVEIVRKQIGKSNAIVKFECGPANSGKIDLVLLLDTSGSIYHTFDNEVSLVKSILSEMRKPIEDKMLRVSLIHFAERPSMAFSLRDELNRAEMIQKVEQIQFSGGITQICDAIQMGQTELEKFGRNGALKVFVLISDGHGHELWPHTMEIGKKLRQQNIQKFAVSMSTDYSKDELMAYIGDTNRIFVGFRQNLFDSTILAFLNQCVNHPSNSHAENAKGNESSTIAATTSVPSNEAKFTEIPNAQTSADGELTTSSKLPTTEQQNDDSSSATVETSTTDGTTNEQTTNATTETTSPFSDQTTLVNLPEETSQQTTITNMAQTADQGSDDQTSQGNSDQTPSVNVNDNANSTNPAQNADQVNGVQTSQGNSDQTPSVNVNGNANSTNSAQADQGSGDQTSQGNSDQTPSVNVNDNENSTNSAQNADQGNGVQTSQGNSDQTPSVNVNGNANSTNSAQADQGSGDQTSQGNSDQTPSVNVNDNANSTNPAQNADQVNGAQITQGNSAQTSQGNSDQGSLVNVNDNANSTNSAQNADQVNGAQITQDNVNVNDNANSTNSAQNADQVNGAQITQGNSDQTPSVNVNDNANSTNPAQDDQGSGDQTSSVNVNDNANSTNPAQNADQGNGVQTSIVNVNDNANSTNPAQAADHGSGDQTSSVNVNDNANSTNPAQNADQGNGVQTSQGNSDQTPSANVNDNANSTNSAQADQSSGDQTTQGKNDQGSSVNVNDNANSTNSAQNVDQGNGAQITQDNGVQTSQGNSDQGSVNLNVNANSTNPSPTNPTQTADQGNGDQTTQGSGGQTTNSDQTSLKLDNSSNSTSSAQNKSAPIVGGSQDMQN